MELKEGVQGPSKPTVNPKCRVRSSLGQALPGRSKGAEPPCPWVMPRSLAPCCSPNSGLWPTLSTSHPHSPQKDGRNSNKLRFTWRRVAVCWVLLHNHPWVQPSAFARRQSSVSEALAAGDTVGVTSRHLASRRAHKCGAGAACPVPQVKPRGSGGLA